MTRLVDAKEQTGTVRVFARTGERQVVFTIFYTCTKNISYRCSLYRVIEGWLSLYQHSTPNRNITNTTHSYDRNYAREKEKRDQTLLIFCPLSEGGSPAKTGRARHPQTKSPASRAAPNPATAIDFRLRCLEAANAASW
ncbi:hypothetical protein LSTR_LSTR010882 [Laodelphax striatellus]|uniref:Uncharacterized protein n=1 Tax=Laodelphax striatellus TaxID=195883 RepID=A0A482XD24_LAOST|nr:hypothetical protein LSTR_LSTR010882 [Laodelphax striatellus]